MRRNWILGGLAVASIVGALALTSGASADTVHFPYSAIGSAGTCGPGDTTWDFEFRLVNQDGAPLVLTAKVTGAGGGTVTMTPNPVPAGGTSVGHIHLPQHFSGTEQTSVNFVDAQYQAGVGSSPITTGTCPPAQPPSTHPDPPVTMTPYTGGTPPTPTTAAPTPGGGSPTSDASTTTTTGAGAEPDATVAADAGADQGTEPPAHADETAGGSSVEAAALQTSLASSSTSSGGVWWLAGVLVIVGLSAAAGAVWWSVGRKRSAGPDAG